jgi:hypothetical protein
MTDTPRRQIEASADRLSARARQREVITEKAIAWARAWNKYPSSWPKVTAARRELFAAVADLDALQEEPNRDR